MKKILLVPILCMIFSSGVYALEISFLTGDVSVIRGDGKVKNPNVGTKILSHDKISTRKKSLVTLSYADGSQVKIQENTTLTIGNMPNTSDSAPVSVITGVVTTHFSKLSKGQDARRSVYTPTTVCAVRGTEFTVAVSEGADSRVELTEGSLDVHNPYGGQKIEAGQNVETGVAQAPQSSDGAVSADHWKADRDAKLDSSAEDRSAKFETYMGDFSSRGDRNSKSIDGIGKKVKSVKDGKSLDAAGKELDGMSGSVEEDMYLSAAAGSSIESIVDRFSEDKSGMREKFLKLKDESNKVKEQLQRNYEAIQAVREAYAKAKDEILNRKKDDIRKIKQGTDLQNVKPKIEKKETETN